ncbi:MAG: hypothetical protein U0T36_10325 [Saprospiraceae bacterium]
MTKLQQTLLVSQNVAKPTSIKKLTNLYYLPEEVALATAQLKAKNLLPVHHSKFQLSTHPWFEPLDEITKYSIGKHYRLATPMIGEMINLNDTTQPFSQWWKKVK